jgi:hypothetical protein
MYDTIEKILEAFGKYTGVDLSCFREEELSKLREIKAKRNELLHGGQGIVTPAYLGECLVTIKYFISEIDAKLAEKYSKYTRVRALKELWNFMFFNPEFVPFEDFWEIDDDEDVVRMKENSAKQSCLSHSEETFLAIWREVLVGLGAPALPRSFSLLSLDDWSRRKVAVFLACSARLGVLVNR